MTCGALVPLELSVCPSCGAAFLARLADDSGRHRSGGASGGSRLPRSTRLLVGLVVGVVLALLVPSLFALIG